MASAGVEVKGVRQLQARLSAITPKNNTDLMRSFALAAIREQKILVPRKTGNLGRSIRLGAVSSTMAETIATADYAAYVELGTKPHIIVPRNAQALAFRPSRGGQVIFAKRVRHPGTRPQPYMLPGAQKALDDLGVESIIEKWNGAA